MLLTNLLGHDIGSTFVFKLSFPRIEGALVILKRNFLMEDWIRKSFSLHHFRNRHLVFGLLAYNNLLEYYSGSTFLLKLCFPRICSSLVERVLAILIGKFFDSKLKPKIIRIYSNNFTKWSNTLKQVVWVCLTILWDWRLKD